MRALLRSGMICDRPTLEAAVDSQTTYFIDEIESKNLEPEHATWFMSEYFRITGQLTSTVSSENRRNIRKDDPSFVDVQTILMTAAESGQHDVVSQLMEKFELDVNVSRSSDGKTALHLSAASNHPTTVRLLLELGADSLKRDASKKTPLHSAVFHLDGVVFETLLAVTENVTQKDSDGFTPLHEAAYHGNTVVVNKLYEKLGDNGFNDIGKTDDGRSLLLCVAQNGSLETVEFFVKVLGNREIWTTAFDGSTALHYAAEAASLPVVQYFLDHGLDVNGQRDNGSTPFHLVAGAVKTKDMDRRSLMEALLVHGANINVKRRDGLTALSLLCEVEHVELESDSSTLSLLL